MKIITLLLLSTFFISGRMNNSSQLVKDKAFPSSILGKWYIQKITMFDGAVKKAEDGKGCLAKSYVIFGEDGKMYNQWFFDVGADTCFAAKKGATDYRIEKGNRISSSEGKATFELKDKNTLVITFDPPEKDDSKITFNFESIEYTRRSR